MARSRRQWGSVRSLPSGRYQALCLAAYAMYYWAWFTGHRRVALRAASG
jgi:hypothetical protein